MKKCYLSLLFSVLLLGRCSSISGPKVFPQSIGRPDVVTTRFFHWNDFHSANIPYKSNWGYTKCMMIVGYATLACHIDFLEQLYPGSVILSAGDDFQGSPISGGEQVKILNKTFDFFT